MLVSACVRIKREDKANTAWIWIGAKGVHQASPAGGVIEAL
jgi:hypothetical protein